MPPTSNTKRSVSKRRRDGNDSDIEINDSVFQLPNKSTGDEAAKSQGTTTSGRPSRLVKPTPKARQLAEERGADKGSNAEGSTSSSTASRTKITPSLVLKALEAVRRANEGVSDDDLPSPSAVFSKGKTAVQSADEGGSDDDLPALTAVEERDGAKVVAFSRCRPSKKLASEVIELDDSDEDLHPRKITKGVVDLKSPKNKKTFEVDNKSELPDVSKSATKSVKGCEATPGSSMVDKMLKALGETGSSDDVDLDEIVSDEEDCDSDDDRFGPVTDEKYQHEALYEIYEELPRIAKLRQVVSYKIQPGDDVPTATLPMERVFRRIHQDNLACILEGLTFARYGRFVNPGRAKLGIYRVEVITKGNNKVSRAMLARCDEHPVFWMIAGVVDSHLVRSTTTFNKPVHGIKVAMFPQEARRDVSVWGRIFGFDDKIAPVDDEGYLSFFTRTEFVRSNDGPSSAPSSPSKGHRIFKTTYTPRAGGSSTQLGKAKSQDPKVYVFERYFEERVPVYNGIATDGRPFSFRNEDFDNLGNREMWTGNGGEIPVGSVVAIGYTLQTWGDRNQNLSPNLNSEVNDLHVYVYLILNKVLNAPRSQI
ncbi:hypothetical protein BDN72DRAFT_864050 [Pluteus cervinus]|uniref:Uncharacterized protein n=1 Tax=Pluteus cervinus TaxID=181527 RepID=A0ACD3A5C4_9AGAR|nr:hypothetical protein BDN72DRAFT_864050 [Pluteus cervinus]